MSSIPKTEEEIVLPHHRPTDPEELKEAKRSRRRSPVLPHHRLSKARWWSLPIPEILFMVGGFVFQQIDSDPLSTMNRLAINAETAGWSALIVGIPLLFVPLRVFWFDIAYIIVGLILYQYMQRFAGEPIIFLGLVLFLGMGMMLSGASCLTRRALAYRLARRRTQK